MPKHYAEALLLDCLYANAPADPADWDLTDDTRKRLQAMRDLAASAGRDRAAAVSAVADAFETSYFAYVERTTKGPTQ